MHQTLKQFSTAAVLIVACTASAVANDRPAQPASAAEAKAEKPELAPAAAARPAEKAAPVVTETEQEMRTSKPPRRPDTPGWRRIMAGPGRT